MTLQVEWTPYGRVAADRLRLLVSEAKAGEPLAPVTVIVPSNYVGVATRRLLAAGTLGSVCGKGTGIAAVTFLTPYRLAELLGAAGLAAAGRRPVSTPVIAAALRAALAEAPGVFAPVAEHPAAEEALVGAYRELRDCSAAALDAVAATGVRAADVVRLCRATRARLESSWYDEEDLVAAAVATLDTGGADVLGLGALIAYLPERLSRHVVELLAAAARNRGITVVAGLTGDGRADTEVTTSISALAERCGEALAPAAVEPAALVAAARTRFVTASDADDEVRAAVRAIVDAARAGTPLDRVAVLYASPEPYARLVHEQLGAAGVATNGAAVTPVAARVAGRTLLGLLALPEGGFRRQDVFAWLTAAPLLYHGRFPPVTAWERLSREAAVVAGVEQWDRLLVILADQRDAAAEKAASDPEAPAWKAERGRDEAARARSLREFVLGLAASLEGAAAGPAAGASTPPGPRTSSAISSAASTAATTGPWPNGAAPSGSSWPSLASAPSTPWKDPSPWPSSPVLWPWNWRTTSAASAASAKVFLSGRSAWVSVWTSNSSSCSAWPRGYSRPGPGPTRSSPTTNAGPPAANFPSAAAASTASTASSSPLWPAPNTTSSASPGGTSAAAPSGPRPASPSPWPRP